MLYHVCQLSSHHRQRFRVGWWHGTGLGSGRGHWPGPVDQLGPISLCEKHYIGDLLWSVHPLGSHIFHSPNTSPTLLCNQVTAACSRVSRILCVKNFRLRNNDILIVDVDCLFLLKGPQKGPNNYVKWDILHHFGKKRPLQGQGSSNGLTNLLMTKPRPQWIVCLI